MIFWILSLQDDFVSKLKNHLLSRLHQYDYDGDEHQFSALECNNLRFVNNLNTVTESKIFHVNYTSYDIRRQQDFMQPGSGCTIMIVTTVTSHPILCTPSRVYMQPCSPRTRPIPTRSTSGPFRPLSLPSRAFCSICDAYVSAHDALLFLSVLREHR